MAASPDPLTLLGRALDQTATAFDAAADAPATTPTPCRSWDLDHLTRHVLDDLGQFRRAAAGERPSFSPEPPAADGDRAALFRAGAEELLEAWSGQDPAQTVPHPLGTVTVGFLITQQITEFAVHGWDLASAVGAVPPADEEVAAAALAFGHASLKPEYRGSEEEGKVFGREVAAAADAAAYDRLAAFFGRDYTVWKR